MRLQVSLIFSAVLLGLATAVSYDGYKVLTIHARNDRHTAALKALKNKFPNDIDFWTHVNNVGKDVDIMVSPAVEHDVVRRLLVNRMKFDTKIENIQTLIDQERKLREGRPRFTKGQRISFTQYYEIDEINTYLDQLAEQYPDLVRVETIGQSLEGRNMNIIRITSNIAGNENKPIFFIDAGIHAREWITPAFALYIINQLVENNTANSDLTSSIEWVILPSFNPDGYQYSWDVDRMWRKTRKAGTLCDGVDANRNFNWHWGEEGGSHFECAEDYAGPEAFSEIEAQNVRDFLTSTQNIVFYLSLHSYAQVIIFPWSYTTEAPDNYQELLDLGNAASDAIAGVAGRKYAVGETVDLMYYAAGTTHDWAKGGANISLSYTIELTGDDYGFTLPEDLILPVVTETWEGVKVFHNYIATK